MKKYYLLIPVLFLFGCAETSNFWDLSNLKPEMASLTARENTTYKDADAVILLKNTRIDVEVSNAGYVYSVETVHVIKKIYKNIEKYASVEIPLDYGDYVFSIEARTIKENGEIITLDYKDFFSKKEHSEKYISYTDDDNVRFTFSGAEKNCMLEYTYSMVRAMPFVHDRWYIQEYLPIVKTYFTLTLPAILTAKNGAGWVFHYQVHNIHLPEPVYSANGYGYSVYTKINWMQENIPAFVPEPYMADESNYMQYVQFFKEDWKNWSEVGKWYFKNYFAPKMVLSDSLKHLTKKLIDGCTTDESKMDKIYKYVQQLKNNNKYLWAGGITPDVPDTIFAKKSIDSKNKTMLMVGMLRTAGIKAFPALIETHDFGTLDQNVPWFSFNKLITQATIANGNVYFLDATKEYCKTGELSSGCADNYALVMNADTSGNLVKTPSDVFSQNTMDIKAKVAVSDSNKALFNVLITYKGEFYLGEKEYFKEKTAEEIKKHCESLIVNKYLNGEVSNCKLSGMDDPNIPFTLSFDFKTDNIMTKQGDLTFISYDPFKYNIDMSWLVKKERKYDVEFPFPFKLSKTIEISYPNKYSIRSMPNEADLIGYGATYQKSYISPDNNKITYVENMAIMHRTIPMKKYEEFRRVFERLQSNANEAIVFTNK